MPGNPCRVQMNGLDAITNCVRSLARAGGDRRVAVLRLQSSNRHNGGNRGGQHNEGTEACKSGKGGDWEPRDWRDRTQGNRKDVVVCVIF